MKDDVIESVERLIVALATARKALRAAELALTRSLREANKSSDLAAAIIKANPANARQEINDALTAVEQRRHEVRRMVFEMALEDGMSIGELGRLWGFSRQLAQRYAKEVRGQG